MRRKPAGSARMALGRLLLAVVLACCLATSARAEVQDETGWQVEFAPYLLLPKITGKTGIHGETVGLDLGYKEILDAVGDHFSLLAGMAHLEVQHDRIFGFLDVMATTLDTGEGVQLKEIEEGPIHTGKIHADID